MIHQRGHRESLKSRWAVCRPSFLAPARIRLVKASCTMGSPPDIVRPPSSARKRGREAGEAINELLCRNVGSVFQMPGVGIVTVGTAQ
jgi:hypothetical protein